MDTAADTLQRAARRALPTGTVTFLFSDIEGSTQRWEANREAMSVAVARHDELMRSAIEAHGGYVFKTVGDAFCASFQSAATAAAAAIDAQRALNAQDFSAVDGLRVRMALHTGLADERDGDYFGPVVNRTARLMAIGHGGQVLVSGATTGLIRELSPAGVTLLDMGAHRLKDLTQPERVHQMIAPDLPAEFPPLRSLDVLKHNLPQQLTRLIGREEDVAQVEGLLSEHRLVTLTGAGGVGKTRLALQAGAELVDSYPDGVWLVELAPLSDPALIAGSVAALFGVRESPLRSLLTALADALKPKRTLLILDNCEHVAEGAAKVADALLRGCPHVGVLTTSREPLRIAGEQVLSVPSLGLPQHAEGLSAAQALHYPAIALFVERAVASDGGFGLSNTNAPIVAEICRRLDGIPLAIELAAARVRALGVGEVLQHLNERFRLLTGGSRTVLPRQQTLRALIDWSYDLLSEKEKALFCRLGIFMGSFDLAAVRSVCAGEPVDEQEILDLLSSLVDKSLLIPEPTQTSGRYRLLESTRAYALERLRESDESGYLASRHAEHYRSIAELAYEQQEITGSVDLFEALAPDLDNFRSALDWGLAEDGDPELGAKLAGALWPVWSRHGFQVEGLGRSETALASLGKSEDRAAARVLVSIAALAYYLSHFRRALEATDRAEPLCRALGDQRLLGWALAFKGTALSYFGKHNEAAKALAEALEIARVTGPPKAVELCLSVQALIELLCGRFDAARSKNEELLELACSQGDEDRVVACISMLAETEFAAGIFSRAIALGREACDRARKRNEGTLSASALSNLAAYLLANGDIEEARQSAREAVEVCCRGGYSTLLVYPLENLAILAGLSGNWGAASRLVGFTQASIEARGTPREPNEQRGYDRLMAMLRDTLGEEKLHKLMAAGAAMSEERAIEEALSV